MRISRWFGLFLLGLFFAVSEIVFVPLFSMGMAQVPSGNDADALYYLYQGEPIPLEVRQDALAVESNDDARERGGEPLYLRLRRELTPEADRDRSSSSNPPGIEVNQLDDNIALVDLSSQSPQSLEDVQQTIQQDETNTVLPVLTRSGGQETIVLPNEIIVSFDPSLSDAQIEDILATQDLEIIRPIRFTTHRYLVRSRSASGLEVLAVTNRLHQVTGIQSATPNFLQTLSGNTPDRWLEDDRAASLTLSASPPTVERTLQSAIELPSSLQTQMMPLLWHLFSPPIRSCLEAETLNPSCISAPPDNVDFPRTDLQIPEAWQISHQGEGVTVAVIDSTIQWHHPNLENNRVSVPDLDSPDAFSVGWDFADDDNDTRMSPGDIALLRQPLQDTFRLSDEDLLEEYPSQAEYWLQHPACQQPRTCSDEQIATRIRRSIWADVTRNFHGTSVASVVAASPFGGDGVVGVAPKATILPIRIGNTTPEGPTLDSAAIIEGINYAAQSGADIINLSLGRSLPSAEQAAVIDEALATYPQLVIVASSGNCGDPSFCSDVKPDQVGYPAGYANVLAVGATTVRGTRASYSQYGKDLAIVAPGGEGAPFRDVLTTGGTFESLFWRGLGIPEESWGATHDERGTWVWQNGTSFASPGVAGVLALMMGEDPNHQLSRQELQDILLDTARYDSLTITPEEEQRYADAVAAGTIPDTVTIEQYFFGAGLVDAEAAVKEVQRRVQ